MQTAPAADLVVAKFNPLYRPYLLVSIGLTMLCTIIGAPIALVWFCGAGQWVLSLASIPEADEPTSACSP